MAKTANIGRLSVSLTADTAKYTSKMKKAQDSASKYGKNMLSMGKMAKSGALVAVAGFAAATVAAKELADQYIETEKQLKSLAETAGLSTKQLKASAYAMSSAGLDAEKLGDIYKDVKDKTSEFAAAGSGAFQDFVDVMKLTKSEGRALSQELQFMSGPQVLQTVVREMQKSKVSMGQMVFVMESLGSDASKLTEILKDQTGQVARLTREYDDLARSADEQNISGFMEAQKQAEIFFNNVGALAVDVLGPVMERFAAGIETINKLIPKSDKDRFGDFGAQKVDMLQSKYAGLGLAERNKVIKAELEKSLKIQEEAMAKFRAVFEDKKNTEVVKQFNYMMGKEIVIGTKLNEEAQLAKEGFNQLSVESETLRAELAKLDKQTEEYEESLKKLRITDLDNIDKIGIGKEQDPFVAESDRYKVQLENLRKNYAAMYSETSEYNSATQRLWIEHQRNLDDIQKKIDDERLAKEKKLVAMKLELRGIVINGANDELAKIQYNHEVELESFRNKYDEQLKATQEYKNAELAIEQKHAEELKKLNSDLQKDKRDKANAEIALKYATTSALLNAAGMFFGQESEMGKKAFALSKSLAIGEMVMNQGVAISEAFAKDPWTGALMAANLAAQIGMQIASIKSLSVEGQAHSGMDSVPQSHDNSSFLLKAGERVVQPEANKDLTAYLNEQKRSGMSSAGTQINAGINLSDKNIIDVNEFNRLLVQQRNIIAGAVRKVEKERPQKRR